MKYMPFFHQKTNYFYLIASVFVEGDFSWRDFSNEFVPLLLNYTAKFGTNCILQPVKEIYTCLKMLHFSCDDISENIKRIKANSDIQNIEDLFDRNKVKMFHNVVARDSFVKLVSDCQTYMKKIRRLQKIFLRIKKKNYPTHQKYFDIEQKRNLFNYKQVLLSYKTLI